MTPKGMAQLLYKLLTVDQFTELQRVLDESQYDLWLEVTRLLRRTRPELFASVDPLKYHNLTLCPACKSVRYKIGSKVRADVDGEVRYFSACSIACCNILIQQAREDIIAEREQVSTELEARFKSIAEGIPDA